MTHEEENPTLEDIELAIGILNDKPGKSTLPNNRKITQNVHVQTSDNQQRLQQHKNDSTTRNTRNDSKRDRKDPDADPCCIKGTTPCWPWYSTKLHFVGTLWLLFVCLCNIGMNIMMIIKYYDNGGFLSNLCMNIAIALGGILFCICAICRKVTIKDNDHFYWGVCVVLPQTACSAIALICFMAYIVHGDDPGCVDANSFVYVLDKNKNTNRNNKKRVKVCDIKINDFVLCIDPISKKLIWDKIQLRLHYHWYNNKNEFVKMKKIYFSKNLKEFITLTYDHLVYVVDDNNKHSSKSSKYKYKIIECENINIGDKLYYFDDQLNELIFKCVIKIDNDIVCQKRAYFGSLPFLLVNNTIVSPFSGTTNIANRDRISARKLHGLKYHFLLTSENIWNIFDQKIKFPLYIQEFIKSFVGLFTQYLHFFIVFSLFIFLFSFSLLGFCL